MSLAAMTAEKIGGTAVAGFGLSLGRSVFLNMKKNLGAALLIGAGILSVFMTFTCGVWITRNYKTTLQSVVKKAGAIISLIPAFAITTAVFGMVILLVFEIFGYPGFLVYPYDFVSWLYSLFVQVNPDSNPDDETKAFVSGSFALSTILFCFGLLKGYRDRKARAIVWDVEQKNDEFLAKNGIVELDESHYRDSEGNRYRLENVFDREIELFAEGRRNKRAYIEMDDNGMFTSWSGLVSIK